MKEEKLYRRSGPLWPFTPLLYDSSQFLLWSCSSTQSLLTKEEKGVPFYHYANANANRGSTKGPGVGNEAPW